MMADALAVGVSIVIIALVIWAIFRFEDDPHAPR